jgi:hypothetical protein
MYANEIIFCFKNHSSEAIGSIQCLLSHLHSFTCNRNNSYCVSPKGVFVILKSIRLLSDTVQYNNVVSLHKEHAYVV